ncbi:hypothetical protein SteCoe_25700 [Stentor coeruleus]|uniref:Uncharacterized protein n=1 Tax=Stentor coeruleus TaxID=5963 RepID=A0A1R2BEM5_9CILI|nr:hypothetical protein SteCoe_25700 [Stentor coeruleus]
MDNCSIQGCRAKVAVICKGSHPPTTFCNDHFTLHQNEPGAHEIVESKQVEISTRSNTYKIESGNQGQAYLVFHFQQAGFLLTFNTVDIHLPKDFKAALDKITQGFTTDVCSLETGKFEDLELKTKIYLEALRKIIYNIELKENILREIITGAYNSLHSRIESFLSSGLIDLLNEAEKSHNMPKSARKRLIISLDLDTEKQRYIQKYFTVSDLNIEEMIEEFYNSFSCFIKDSDRFFSSRFKDFNKMFKQEKIKITEETKKTLQERLSSYYDMEAYIRAGLFTLKITNPGPIIKVSGDWIMIACLILQKASCTLVGIVEISDDEMLIGVTIGNESFIIYYSLTSTSIALAFSSVSFIIASGSTPDAIIIAQNYPKSIDLYKLKLGKLEHSNKYDFKLQSNEQIIGLAYIKDMDKAVFICNNNTLNSKVLSVAQRVNISLKNDTEKLHCLEYYKEKKIICLKTVRNIRFYSEHLQPINVIEIPGSTFACINNGNKEAYFLILGGENLSEIRADFGYNSADKEQVNVRNTFENFEECKYSRSHDFSIVPSQKNKYIGNVNKKFGVPDNQPQFRNMLIKPSQDLIPSHINLVPEIKKTSNVIPSPFMPGKIFQKLIDIPLPPKLMNTEPPFSDSPNRIMQKPKTEKLIFMPGGSGPFPIPNLVTSQLEQNIKKSNEDESLGTHINLLNDKLTQSQGDINNNSDDSDKSSDFRNDIRIYKKNERKLPSSIPMPDKVYVPEGISVLPALKPGSPKTPGLPIPSMPGGSTQYPPIPSPSIPLMPGGSTKNPPIPNPPILLMPGGSTKIPPIPNPPNLSMPGGLNKIPPIPNPPNLSMPGGSARNPPISNPPIPSMPGGSHPSSPILSMPGGLLPDPPIPSMRSKPPTSLKGADKNIHVKKNKKSSNSKSSDSSSSSSSSSDIR